MGDAGHQPRRRDQERRSDLTQRFKELVGLSWEDATVVVYREALRQRRGNPDDANELAQSVWERIVTRIQRGQTPQVRHANAWLRRFVRSTAIDQHRRDTAQKRSPAEQVVSLNELSSISELASPAPGPYEILAQKDLRERLHHAILALEDDQKAVVVRVLLGLSFPEIGEDLGIPLSTAKDRFRSAVKNLRADDGLASE